MKRKFINYLMGFLVFGLGLAGFFGLNLTKTAAQVLPPAPTIQFSDSSLSGTEKMANPEITVALSGISSADTTVDYKVTSINALSGKNYILSNGSLVVPTGQLSSDIPLQIIDDKTFDLTNKSLDITLSNPLNPVLPTLSLGLSSTLTYIIVEDNTPITTLTKVPSAALGTNGFYQVAPEITLMSDRAGTTYYQWDAAVFGSWIIYGSPFSALEGDHTLYFYSDAGNGFAETVQSETIKSDTINPAVPIIDIIVSDNGKINLSWQKIDDAVKFQIFRDGKKIKTLSAGTTQFEDWIATNGRAHNYYVFAFDRAGHRVKSHTITAKINIAAPVIVQVQPEVVASLDVTPVVAKKIGFGATTQSNVSQITESSPIAPAVQGESQEVTTPQKSEETENNSQKSRNWNKLLLAISILIIAAGIAIGGYYGYEWYINRKDGEEVGNNPKNKSRW